MHHGVYMWGKDTADRMNGLERPKPNEGYALENDVSNNRVTEKPPVVNTQSMQNGEKYSPGAFLPAEKMQGPTRVTPDGERGNEGTRDGKPVPYDETFDEVPVDVADGQCPSLHFLLPYVRQMMIQ